MKTECDLDENGVCKTHGPGTVGEVEVTNELINRVKQQLAISAKPLAELGIILNLADEAVKMENKRLIGLGREPLREIEGEMVKILRPVARLMKDAFDQLDALHLTHPSQLH